MTNFRWEGSTVDLASRDLPGLKARFLVDRVPSEGTVLDVGCGGGKMLRTLAVHRPETQRLGCDVRDPAEVRDFEFRRVDASNGILPYPDSSVDVALVIDVLEHVTDPKAFLAEVARVVRSGGSLVAFIPVEGERRSFYRLFRGLLGRDLYVATKDHVHAFSHSDVERLVEQHFIVEERRYAYHFIGHLMDATLFALVRNRVIGQLFWNESPYHNRDRQRSFVARVFAGALVAANRLAWAESSALPRVRATSAGVLLSARRP